MWQKKIFGITTPAMGAGGRAYIATYNKDDQQGAVEGRDQDGAKRWEMKLPRPHAALAPPAVGVGVRAPGDTSSVRCNANPRDHRHFSQADDVYLPTSDGLYALDYKGRTRWVERDVGRTFVGAPVVVQLQNGEQIIIVADTGASSSLLHAFAHDGRRLWQVALDSPSRGSPAVAHGRIYVATERSLYAVGFVAPRLPVGVTTLPRR